jgi:Skp family chaperone for outer membrane proteins
VKSQKKMTEKIQNSIEEILGKVRAIHTSLEAERKKNTELEAKVKQLQVELADKTNHAFSLSTEVETLHSALKLAQSKVVEVPSPVLGKREEEIDELVREIEHCIEQLKQ